MLFNSAVFLKKINTEIKSDFKSIQIYEYDQ